MQYHIVPEEGIATKEALLAWAKDELAKPGPPVEEAEVFDWNAMLKDQTALTDETFGEFVSNKQDSVVMFFSKQCKFSGATAPLFAEARNTLPLARMAFLDVETGLRASIKYAIEELPTIMLIRGGNRFRVLNPNQRSLQEIKDFVMGVYIDDAEGWRSALEDNSVSQLMKQWKEAPSE